MKFTVIKLKPKGPFHIGFREGWLESTRAFVPADTLFSALCHCYRMLYGDLLPLLERFRTSSPPFLISSAFPFRGDRYYFPLPKNQMPADKKLKKAQFVDLQCMEQLLAGVLLEKLGKDQDLIASDGDRPWRISSVPRIGLSRMNNHPNEDFFYFGQVSYDQDAGLFVLLRVEEESLRKQTLALFMLMSQEGLGGDRSVGRGHFYTPEVKELDIAVPADSDACYTLSPYYPDGAETAILRDSYYELEERRGYIFSPDGRSLRRCSVRMLAEGSVLNGAQHPKGKLVDVTPEMFTAHRVYRSGCLMALPCRREVV